MTKKRILYLQYTNPAGYPPIEHSGRIFADAGWHVLYLGTHGRGVGDLHIQPHPRVEVRQLSFCNPGVWQKLHYLWFCLWAAGWALGWGATWVYASDLLACPPAVLLSVLLRRKLVYHEHDSPVRGGRTAFQKVCFCSRRLITSVAKLCILPNEQRAKRFASEMNNARRVCVVWNAPTKAEVVAQPTTGEVGALRLYYHGSIGSPLIPMTLIEALALLPDQVSLTIVGYETVGSSGYSNILTRKAEAMGVTKRVKIFGPQPRRLLLEKCRGFDVGVALFQTASEDVNFQFLAGASNKPFDYLACGLPVLVSDHPQWLEMLVHPGYGLACDPSSAEGIAIAVRWLLANPELRRRMGRLGRQKVLDDWNYDRQFQPIFDALSGSGNSGCEA